MLNFVSVVYYLIACLYTCTFRGFFFCRTAKNFPRVNPEELRKKRTPEPQTRQRNVNLAVVPSRIKIVMDTKQLSSSVLSPEREHTRSSKTFCPSSQSLDLALPRPKPVVHSSSTSPENRVNKIPNISRSKTWCSPEKPPSLSGLCETRQLLGKSVSPVSNLKTNYVTSSRTSSSERTHHSNKSLKMNRSRTYISIVATGIASENSEL